MEGLHVKLLRRQNRGLSLCSDYQVAHDSRTIELCSVGQNLPSIWDEMSDEMHASIEASERIAVTVRFFQRHPELDPSKVRAAKKLLSEWEAGSSRLDRAA
ncbi:MAG TPA: hypothetical protein VFJ58_00400 [Armatimonadota bacterium]|nr:hypothetical protein [Armatimonadota bacterium]